MRRIIYNDDSQGVSEVRPGHGREDLEAWVDKPLSRLAIDTYAWCICFPDVCMHQSKVGEVYGARFPEPPNAAAAAIAELGNRGEDVLDIVAARAHHHDVEIVASVRMNDTHGMFPDPGDPQMSRFLLEHPELVIRRTDGVPERALDYTFAEVRAHRLAIIGELAQQYDIDGIELDFTRWAKLFPREQALSGIEIMTDFVGQVRATLDAAADRRGRQRLVLGVQVLESLYLNLLSGLDPRTWVENGWLDYLIQCDFNCTNPQIPVAEFADFCRPSDCTHHVRMGNMMGGGWSGKPHTEGRQTAAYKGNPSYGGMVLTPAEARGAAANIYGFGADGIGLWNICCNMGDRHKADATGPSRHQFQEDMMAWIEAVSSPEVMLSAPRHYHFVPIHKKEALPVRNYPVNALRMGPTGSLVQIVHFWANSCGFRQPFRFLMADGRRGEELTGCMRWRLLGSSLDDEFTFDLNRVPIPPASVSRQLQEDEDLPAVWYEVDLTACPAFAGDNELGLTLTKYGNHHGTAEQPYMEELEIIVENTP